MTPSKVLLRLPATSANLGPGFDCLGLALDLWSAATLESREVEVEPGPNGLEPLPQMALAAARAFYEASGVAAPRGLSFDWHNGFPLARGLGASAAVRAAALLGANALAGSPLDVEDLLPIGASLEDHADNITAALLGGLQVAVWEQGRVLHAPVQVPAGLKVVLMVPDMAMPTDESRRLLAAEVPRDDAVYNVGHASLLVAALAGGQLDLLAAACDDRLHQPARSQLLPAMNAIIDAARGAGALCSYLSGGGSTIAAWTLQDEKAIARAMLQAAQDAGCPGETLITTPSAKGAQVLTTE
ncbi:MAG TPA: homoserine kinase [Dehalococcoidia bacterium]|nr:homoserine kinase [Dehalococcoidia bacterium]